MPSDLPTTEDLGMVHGCCYLQLREDGGKQIRPMKNNLKGADWKEKR